MQGRPVCLALLPMMVALPIAMSASGCGGKASASLNTPTGDPSATPYTGPAPMPTGAPTAAGPTAPGSLPPLTGTGPATPIAPMAAAVVQPILVSMGQAEAQGGLPDGSPFAGQFGQGQVLEQPINIKGNGCYTVVAASMGIQQLDVALVVTPPMMQPMTVAQSSTTGPNATLGGKVTGCWRNPTPLMGTGKVVMRATAGQGLAAAQVFSK